MKKSFFLIFACCTILAFGQNNPVKIEGGRIEGGRTTDEDTRSAILPAKKGMAFRERYFKDQRSED